MFTLALFTIAKNWKQSRWLLRGEWIKKFTQWSIIQLSKKLYPKICRQIELEKKIILSEVNQTKKDKYGIFSFIRGC